jgi:hypothetical protein
VLASRSSKAFQADDFESGSRTEFRARLPNIFRYCTGLCGLDGELLAQDAC